MHYTESIGFLVSNYFSKICSRQIRFLIDMWIILITLVGVIVSMGLVGKKLISGLNLYYALSQLICICFFAYIRLHRGIKQVSLFNIGDPHLLLLFVCMQNQISALFTRLFYTLGQYISHFPETRLNIGEFEAPIAFIKELTCS